MEIETALEEEIRSIRAGGEIAAPVTLEDSLADKRGKVGHHIIIENVVGCGSSRTTRSNGETAT
jgi:hypothetical protein